MCFFKCSLPHLKTETCGKRRELRDSPESRLSRPAGQSGLSRKFFGTGQTGSGQFKNSRCPERFSFEYEILSYTGIVLFYERYLYLDN